MDEAAEDFAKIIGKTNKRAREADDIVEPDSKRFRCRSIPFFAETLLSDSDASDEKSYGF